MSRQRLQSIASALADEFLSGPTDVDSVAARCSRVIGKRRRWLQLLAQRVCDAFQNHTGPRLKVVATFILNDRVFRAACKKHQVSIVARPVLDREMRPASGFPFHTDMPSIVTAGALAEWLDIDIRELMWIADRHGFERKISSERGRRYRYRLLSKGSRHFRIIESPKRRLKRAQRKILREILDCVPVHPAVHGFQSGRSITSFVHPHVGQRVVLKLDLMDFFPSIHLSRVAALFRTIGYPEEVADLLAGMCSNTVPAHVLSESNATHFLPRNQHGMRRYEFPHLPQGAPTSPAIANLCAYRLDCRLSALAAVAGAKYTRYADDLAFSGDESFNRGVQRFSYHVAAIVIDEGFAVNFRKTRIMRQSQRQSLCGLVINKATNIRRSEYDELRAILHNCIRQGPDSQNREQHPSFREHLAGRIAFVASVNATRGQRLREQFALIRW